MELELAGEPCHPVASCCSRLLQLQWPLPIRAIRRCADGTGLSRQCVSRCAPKAWTSVRACSNRCIYLEQQRLGAHVTDIERSKAEHKQ
ncbi:hypothetical protein GUJ93_ZPchr0006g41528 [Zizania palustris]|uniref:Uncharacterized protein n=1 Tax=Zizania palustris TaxID=103762 RepID=A0A8J5VMP6_ZIZPA|nr:hypothetical protein GUJ93_ZPchr0006g41528 [Zizania palustris]